MKLINWLLIVAFYISSPAVVFANEAKTSVLPPLSSYFKQGGLDFVKKSQHADGCHVRTHVRVNDHKPGTATLTIDRMPIDDADCQPKPRSTQNYKLFKRYTDCGRIVYTDTPGQSIDRAELVLIDSRTSPCLDKSKASPKAGSIVIRQKLTGSDAQGPDFFSIP